MKLSFFPKEESYYEAFQAQAKILDEAAVAFKHLLEQYQNVEEQVDHIEDLEHQGDEILRDTSIKLYKTFITPLDRKDIHDLISVMDDVLDYIRAAAVRLVLLGIKVPRPPAHALADLLVKATREIKEALAAMESNRDVLLHTEQLKIYEKEGDLINRQAVSELFQENVSELEVIQWMSVYSRLETALDKCKDVAQILESAMLKNA